MVLPNEIDENCQERPINTNFEEIFHQSPIGIFLYDKNGVLTNANDSALSIARIPKLDDVLGTNLFDNPKIASRKEEILKKKFIKFQDTLNLIKISEQNIYNPLEKKIIDIDWTVSVIDSGYMVQIQDITQLKKTERDLKNSLGYYHGLFNNIDEGLQVFEAIYNDNGVICDLRFIEVNPAYEAHTGVKPESIVGKTIKEAYPDTEQICFKAFTKVLKTGKSINFNQFNEQLNRHYEVHVFRFAPNQLAMLFNDITAHKKTEKALRESSERLVRVAQAGVVGLYEYNINKDESYWSPEAYELFGLEPQSLANYEQWITCIHPDDRERIGREMAEVMEEFKTGLQDTTQDTEYRVMHNDGTVLWLKAKSTFNFEDDSMIIRGAVYNFTDHKKAEEEISKLYNSLQESEEKYRNIIEIANEGILIADPSGIITYVNARMAEMLGYTEEELIGTDVISFVDEEEVEFGEKKVENRKKGIQESYEIKCRKKNGEELWFLVSATPMYDNNGKHIANMTMQTDITERKHAEESLKENEKKLSRLYESGLLGIIYWNMDNKIVDANDKFLEIVGYTREDLESDRINWFEMTPPEYRYLDERSVVELKATGVNKEPFEKVYIHKDGSHIPILIAGAFLDEECFNGVAFVLDIAEHKKAEKQTQDLLEQLQQINEELIKSEKKYRNIVETANEGIIMADPSGIITFVNDKIVEMFGYSVEELLGTDGLFLIDKNELEIAYKQIEDRKIGINEEYERKFIRKNGDEIWTIVSASSLQDNNGIHTGNLSMITNITQRKKREKELELTMNELKRSNQELERFAYVSSHDLQEPLRMVTLYSQLLERRYKNSLDDDADDFIEYIVDNSKRMKQLIDDLLEYSRVTSQAKEFEDFDLEKILDIVLTNLSVSIAENNVKVNYKPLPIVFADKNQMMQVFQNLITNAIKFRGVESPEINISAQKGQTEWTFSISDNGIGIKPEHKKQIFDVFKRLHTREEYPGTGIGLSICQKIVKHHGGRIWVESELEKGSTFYFTIPFKI